jgi:hypothetical protein
VCVMAEEVMSEESICNLVSNNYQFGSEFRHHNFAHDFRHPGFEPKSHSFQGILGPFFSGFIDWHDLCQWLLM